jgi:hypothetical protein
MRQERTGNIKLIGLALGALLLALSFPAQAQQPKKIPRIGYLSTGDPATEFARAVPIRRALRTIPIVMGGPGNDPVEAGLVGSLARPGGNITGL